MTPPIGPVQSGLVTASQRLGVEYYVNQLLATTRDKQWTLAKNYAGTVGNILKGKADQLVKMVEEIRDISRLLQDAGASAKDIEAVEGVITALEDAAKVVGTIAETEAELTFMHLLIIAAFIVAVLWLLSGRANAEEMPKSKQKKLPQNPVFDPLRDLETARKNLVNFKRKQCACSRKSRHVSKLHANFPTGAGMHSLTYGGGGSASWPSSQAGASAQGTVGKPSAHGASGKPTGGRGGVPDPFGFPKSGGPPLARPGTKGPSGPSAPDARPDGACMWPLCEKITSSFG